MNKFLSLSLLGATLAIVTACSPIAYETEPVTLETDKVTSFANCMTKKLLFSIAQFICRMLCMLQRPMRFAALRVNGKPRNRLKILQLTSMLLDNCVIVGGLLHWKGL